MRIPILTFGAIASVLTINSTFADTKTITTQDYVDNQDDAIYEYVDDELATKQDLIETNDSYWDGHGYGEINGRYLGVENTLVTNSTNNGIQGYEYGIFDGDSAATVSNWGGARWILVNEDAEGMEQTVPTSKATAQLIKDATKMTCTACRNGQPPCIADECLLWQLPNTAVSW